MSIVSGFDLDISSLPTRGGWIEIDYRGALDPRTESLPTRGGWIEMQNDK